MRAGDSSDCRSDSQLSGRTQSVEAHVISIRCYVVDGIACLSSDIFVKCFLFLQVLFSFLS
jgi:hypothetical protein